ncbi:ABC transporter [Nonlabens sp. MB-3u-79]|jgi:lipoprotein-releasing system permease protein|uniref:ABC transporter permease n=1 Tax=Nonlabens sp. MB-3u-79 TaxID=2058134 RepID=UPI000C316A37|nr:FtsX-like permease family protein [Nonlabens sp. MB-3u-79]AUC80272.1 ABC transporter [Nonlabens sp. MB-3u-79]|tara:strand:- start:18761 stop:20023 length:1263 start_codon:yes stop_codon:yes gene_type:complete
MINWSVILSIAKTHLLSRFKQTAVAALGVTFGIGSYITLVCFMTGLNGMLDSLILNQTPHIHVFNEIEPSQRQPISYDDALVNGFNIVHSIKPKQNQLRITNALPLLQYLNKNPDILSVLPQVKTQVFYKSGAIEIGGLITGIDPLKESQFSNLDDYILNGSSQSLINSSNGILLGSGIAKKMALKVGDRIQIMTPSNELLSLKIVGLFQTGIAEIDDSRSYTKISKVQQILMQPKNYITDLNIKLKDITQASRIAQEIAAQYHLNAVDINTANAQFETGTTIRNLITYAVSITLLIVAGFGIYNILNMLIYEKMNDIAILKATGFSGIDVQYIFMSQALIIGIIGGILGLLLGLGLTLLIDQTPFNTEALPTITTYPINNNPVFYLIGIVFALFSTFLAGVLPSRKARNIDPVSIIRGQ